MLACCFCLKFSDFKENSLEYVYLLQVNMKILMFPHSPFNVLKYEGQVVISHGTDFSFF